MNEEKTKNTKQESSQLEELLSEIENLTVTEDYEEKIRQDRESNKKNIEYLEKIKNISTIFDEKKQIPDNYKRLVKNIASIAEGTIDHDEMRCGGIVNYGNLKDGLVYRRLDLISEKVSFVQNLIDQELENLEKKLNMDIPDVDFIELDNLEISKKLGTLEIVDFKEVEPIKELAESYLSNLSNIHFFENVIYYLKGIELPLQTENTLQLTRSYDLLLETLTQLSEKYEKNYNKKIKTEFKKLFDETKKHINIPANQTFDKTKTLRLHKKDACNPEEFYKQITLIENILDSETDQDGKRKKELRQVVAKSKRNKKFVNKRYSFFQMVGLNNLVNRFDINFKKQLLTIDSHLRNEIKDQLGSTYIGEVKDSIDNSTLEELVTIGIRLENHKTSEFYSNKENIQFKEQIIEIRNALVKQGSKKETMATLAIEKYQNEFQTNNLVEISERLNNLETDDTLAQLYHSTKAIYKTVDNIELKKEFKKANLTCLGYDYISNKYTGDETELDNTLLDNLSEKEKEYALNQGYNRFTENPDNYKKLIENVQNKLEKELILKNSKMSLHKGLTKVLGYQTKNIEKDIEHELTLNAVKRELSDTCVKLTSDKKVPQTEMIDNYISLLYLQKMGVNEIQGAQIEKTIDYFKEQITSNRSSTPVHNMLIDYLSGKQKVVYWEINNNQAIKEYEKCEKVAIFNEHPRLSTNWIICPYCKKIQNFKVEVRQGINENFIQIVK